MAGNLQYPHTGEQTEGKDNGTSERKACADQIKDWFHVPYFPHNFCLKAVEGSMIWSFTGNEVKSKKYIVNGVIVPVLLCPPANRKSVNKAQHLFTSAE